MYDDNSQFSNIFNKIAENAIEKSVVGENDYTGEDGLLYCGNCHTRKQYRLNCQNGREFLLPVMCKCRSEQKKEEEERIRNEKKQRRIENIASESGIEDRFKDADIDKVEVTSDNERQINIAKRYIEKFEELYQKNQGLLLYGECGTGKSLIASCIANSLIKAGNRVISVSVTQIIDSKNEPNKIFDLEKKSPYARLLVIDDLGAERDTSYALEKVYNLVNKRYVDCKPMIVTTNLSLTEMKNETNDRCRRIYDRILEVCYPVKFTGKSWRRKEAANRYYEIKNMLEG